MQGGTAQIEIAADMRKEHDNRLGAVGIAQEQIAPGLQGVRVERVRYVY
jgi:hypothetical protein